MRLITRPDFDGLACAALPEGRGLLDGCLSVHPEDVQEGKIPVLAGKVLAEVVRSLEAKG